MSVEDFGCRTYEGRHLSEGLSMTMPSAQRYRGFLDALRKNVLAFDSAEHDEQRLAAALAVLQGVVLYLQGDEEIADERLARPLGWLESVDRRPAGRPCEWRLSCLSA